MPVVLGAAHQTPPEISELAELRSLCRAEQGALLFYMPACAHRELLLLGMVHGRAGGCLCLWELTRLIPVFHAFNYFGEEISGVKEWNDLIPEQ